MALSKVENALKGSPYVELPMVYALSSKDYCVALVCPAHAALRELAQAQGLPADDLAALCEHPKIVAVRARRAGGAEPHQRRCAAAPPPPAARTRPTPPPLCPRPPADPTNLRTQRNPPALQAVSKSCAEACKAARLAPFEVPKKLGLVADGWTPENDMLTAAMKLKRNQVRALGLRARAPLRASTAAGG